MPILLLLIRKKKYKLTIDAMQSKSRQSAKIFEGIEVTGEIVSTIVRGNFVKENGAMVADKKGIGLIVKPACPSLHNKDGSLNAGAASRSGLM